MDPKKIFRMSIFAGCTLIFLLFAFVSKPAASFRFPSGNELTLAKSSADPSSAGLVPVTAGEPGNPSKNPEDDGSTVDNASLSSAEPGYSFISLNDFADAVQDGSSQIKGLYSKDRLSLRVVQQPEGKNSYVSSISGVATQFRAASQGGNIGMLAHNFAGGASFGKVQLGDEISVIYGNGSLRTFKVAEIQHYQALQPDSPTSSFIDLTSREKLSASEVFRRVYSGKAHLTLQTCIAQGEVDSWGRLFVIAYPVD